MSNKQLPLKVIQAWMKDSNWRVRTAAMNACQGREIPIEIIQAWMKDSDRRVRTAAMNQYKQRGIQIPITRTFEPPATVYKKCLGGVIVYASIAKDAQVRGAVGKKCRTNKATITNVLGTIAGEYVGISKYDMRTTYYAGDDVYVPDFDFSTEECSTGFHFFCSLEEAEAYNF